MNIFFFSLAISGEKLFLKWIVKWQHSKDLLVDFQNIQTYLAIRWKWNKIMLESSDSVKLKVKLRRIEIVNTSANVLHHGRECFNAIRATTSTSRGVVRSAIKHCAGRSRSRSRCRSCSKWNKSKIARSKVSGLFNYKDEKHEILR